MNIYFEAQSLLDGTGYFTESLSTNESLHFEDEIVFGFVFVYPSVEVLLQNWESDQDKFLQTRATKIRLNPGKAWNAYSVLLTSGAVGQLQSKLLQIEEDFRGSRKIVRGAVSSPDDVKAALLPLLPVESRVQLARDIAPRLAERLTILNPTELAALLNGDVDDLIASVEQQAQ